jgi:hypothetical protein
MSAAKYKQVPASEVPGNLIWVTPRRNQNQIVEVSYSTGIPARRGVNYEADEGSPWMRELDHSDRITVYYRRTGDPQ